MLKDLEKFLPFGIHFERYYKIRRVALKAVTLDKEYLAHQEFWNFLKARNFKGDELSVVRKDLQDYAAKQFKNKAIKSNTARNKIYVLKHFYHEAVLQGWILSSPWAGITLPKVEQNPIEVLTVKQMKQLLEAPDLNTIKGIRDRTIFELMYSSALRVGDLISLTADQFSGDYRTLRLKGKGDKESVLPVGKVAAHFMKFYTEQIYPKTNTKGHSELFVSLRSGQHMSKNVLYQLIGSYGKQLFQGRYLGTHVFRYSICTHLADEGVDIRLIQEFMRHGKPSTTMSYVHQSYQKLQQVFNDTHPRS